MPFVKTKTAFHLGLIWPGFPIGWVENVVEKAACKMGNGQIHDESWVREGAGWGRLWKVRVSRLSRRGTEAGMSGGALGQGRGEEDLGCGDSWRRLPAALHVWAWILSELSPHSLAPSLSSLYKSPLIFSSADVEFSCEEKGGGERIPRVLLTDGVRGNILALRKRMKNLSLLTIALAKNFMRFFS